MRQSTWQASGGNSPTLAEFCQTLRYLIVACRIDLGIFGFSPRQTQDFASVIRARNKPAWGSGPDAFCVLDLSDSESLEFLRQRQQQARDVTRFSPEAD